MKYKKKSVEIEAIQWKGNNFEEINNELKYLKYGENIISQIIYVRSLTMMY